MDKIRVESIELIRAEGPVPLDPPRKLSRDKMWEQADKVLHDWSNTAPRDCKTYDKCDFVITYQDSETYKGTYDLKHWLCQFPDLGKHVREFVTFHAGRRKPAWMTDEQYQNVMGMPHIQEMKPEFERFLKNYEIPGVLS